MFITHMQSLFGWSNACYDTIYTLNTIPVRLVTINLYENSLTGLSQTGYKIVIRLRARGTFQTVRDHTENTC
jgi:hypothetical protein